MTTATAEGEKPEIPKVKESEIKLPCFETPQMFLDEQTGMMWVCLPLRKLEPVDCVVILDRAKFDAVAAIKKYAKMAKIVRPAAAEAFVKMKNWLHGMGKA